METLSTPVSSLRAAVFFSASNSRDTQQQLFKPSQTHPSNTFLSNKLSNNSCNSFLSSTPKPLVLRSASTLRCSTNHSSSDKCHSRASTGYAAALLDAAYCRGMVELVERDVRWVANKLHNVINNESLDKKIKEAAVKSAAEKDGLSPHLAVSLQMLVAKGLVGLVTEVLEEFGRLYDKLTGTARVLVVSPYGRKGVREEEIAAVARRVQRDTGAFSVRIHHLICRSKPSQTLGVLK